MGKGKKPLSTTTLDFMTSVRDNGKAYFKYFTQLSNIAMSRFEWTGLPDTIDTRFLELILYFNGQAIIFKDEVMGWLVTRWTGESELDVYDVPVVRRAFANNVYNNTLYSYNSVVIYNNMLRQPISSFIDYQSKRLYDYDKAIDINASAQKTPILIRCQKHMLMSLKNLYAKFTGNEPVIYANDEVLDDTNFKVLKTDAPFVADKLQSLKSATWNETLTYLGIPNVTYQKSERMITDEVARMMGGTVASVESEIFMRKQAIASLKKLAPEDFKDANVEFKFSNVSHETYTGGDTNVNLYSDSETDM